VYLVDDPLGRRQLAVKMMLPEMAADPVVRDRFLREARSASAVEHDNVVTIYQVGEEGNTPFLVMPFLRGESLEHRLQRDPLPPLPLLLKVGRETALGLAAAHEKGLVHRDAKPGNTWLEGDPSAADLADQVRRVKVLDFGLARAADGTEAVSVTGTVVGTPAYMAPEQARGERVDGRADLFSLGAILYRMATGRPAFAGPTITAVLTAIATHNPPTPISVNPALPPALSHLIERLLEKNADQRPRSAHEVVAALDAIEKGQSPSRSPRRWWVIGAALLLLCVVAVGARALFDGSQPDGTVQGDTKGRAPPTDPKPPDPTPAPQDPVRGREPDQRTGPFRVKSLDVSHYATTPDGNEPRGVLGKESFSPLRGDRVQLVAKLSRPGYGYIIAFRADGELELCFPNDEDTVPPLTDTPRYPLTDGVKAYGLREGTGLWVFAVVASEKELPTYRQWLASRKPNWKRESAALGEVWQYDGAVVERLLPGQRPIRAKDEELTGPAATVQSLGRWLGQTPDATIWVLGFGVGPRK
jgi:serine/threonine protein kinase